MGCQPLEGFPGLLQDPHVVQQVIVFALHTPYSILHTPHVALAKVDESSPDEEGGAGLPLEVTPEIKAGHNEVTLNEMFLCTLGSNTKFC